jgi:hypothetical protein
MKISLFFFLAFEGANAFVGQASQPAALTRVRSTPGGDYSYSYGGNTMREGSPNTNGDVPVGGADQGRVVGTVGWLTRVSRVGKAYW